jgi:sporulation related protein
MKYDFTLDRKGMISVLASSVLLGALLFVAGLILGSYWTANGPTVSAAAAKPKAAEINVVPQEPVLVNDVPQSSLLLPGKPAVTLGPQTIAPATIAPPQTAQPAPQPQAGSDQPASTASEQGADNKTGNAPAPDGSAPQAPKASDSATQGPADSQLVTVEVGTFPDANAANGLFKSLERKGYAPTFFTGRDAQSREWYSIRIGAYSDKQQAENAAANFAKQEKIKAKVRPLGSL